MNLRDLMERWADVGDETIGYDFEDFEYDRGLVEVLVARVAPPDVSEQWRVVHGRKCFGGNPGNPAFDSHILAAVIEAIEARAGDWSLAGGKSRPTSAIVTHVIQVDGTLRVGSVIGPDKRTPAEALLAAYLKAIAKESA